MNRFTDNVVLITGGGTGIGRATAFVTVALPAIHHVFGFSPTICNGW